MAGKKRKTLWDAYAQGVEDGYAYAETEFCKEGQGPDSGTIEECFKAWASPERSGRIKKAKVGRQ